MPAGVTWGAYLRFVSAAMLTMFVGAQCVHLVYRPMDDMPHYVERERQRRLAARAVTAPTETPAAEAEAGQR